MDSVIVGLIAGIAIFYVYAKVQPYLCYTISEFWHNRTQKLVNGPLMVFISSVICDVFVVALPVVILLRNKPVRVIVMVAAGIVFVLTSMNYANYVYHISRLKKM